jgi:hypothetical protein
LQALKQQTKAREADVPAVRPASGGASFRLPEFTLRGAAERVNAVPFVASNLGLCLQLSSLPETMIAGFQSYLTALVSGLRPEVRDASPCFVGRRDVDSERTLASE